jgi:hypothetical protein
VEHLTGGSLGYARPYSQTLDLAGRASQGQTLAAYYEDDQIMAGKGFITLGRGKLARITLRGTITLAYCDEESVVSKKCFILLRPGVNVIKLFFFLADNKAK